MNVEKYNQPVPRYTSYPTVPHWDTASFSVQEFEKTLESTFWESDREISVYIHLPFCESLCTYCACNTRITKNHQVETPYIDHLLQEWELYMKRLPDTPVIREVHLGGGTPTFFEAGNLERLLNGLFAKARVSDLAQMSFEGHPANTSTTHLKTLRRLGFRRLSLGIQDFDPQVQQLIHRRQSFEQVRATTEMARTLGYTSVNFDMVYGLPGQTYESLEATLEKVRLLSPDRIAYYSYAHVPTMRPAQRSFEKHLPKPADKLNYLEVGRRAFRNYGYLEVGMDHFVKPGDDLLKAQQNGTLHRNFMGYTPFSGKLLIGLGASSIGDSWIGFAQNEKKVEDYYRRLDRGELPFVKGHIHTADDFFLREQILNLMCTFKTTWSDQMQALKLFDFESLREMEHDGLLTVQDQSIVVSQVGRSYIRVICSALDARANQSKKRVTHSRTV